MVCICIYFHFDSVFFTHSKILPGIEHGREKTMLFFTSFFLNLNIQESKKRISEYSGYKHTHTHTHSDRENQIAHQITTTATTIFNIQVFRF